MTVNAHIFFFGLIKYGTFVYVIDVQFLFLMTIKTFENLYVVHHGNYLLKIARVLNMTFY